MQLIINLTQINENFKNKVKIIKQMQMSKLEISKLSSIPPFLFHNTTDELNHVKCDCDHCMNNTKPLPIQKKPRIVQKDQQVLNRAQAFSLIAQKLANSNFKSKVMIPDVYIVSQAILIYSNKLKKIKARANLTNIEVKKHYEERKRKFVSGISTSVTNNFSMSLISNENIPKNRDTAILTYNDSTEQLLSESLLNKIIQKRKSDNLWQETSYIIFIPFETQQQSTTYNFERNEDNISVLDSMMDSIVNYIDMIDEACEIADQDAQNKLTSMLNQDKDPQLQFLEEEMMAQSVFQNQLTVSKNYGRPAKSYMNPKKSKINIKKNSSFTPEQSQLKSVYSHPKYVESQTKQISQEIVSYLQVVHHIRILKADFVFWQDGKDFYLSKVENMVKYTLKPKDLTLLHDRYESLEEVDIEEIIDTKMKQNKIEEQSLLKLCASILQDCLEFRRIQLKLSDYVKPSHETLMKIYLKIFPDFLAEKMFQNVNWKNQLVQFAKKSRTKINKVIREDEGIRILKRFGISFKRTFS